MNRKERRAQKSHSNTALRRRGVVTGATATGVLMTSIGFALPASAAPINSTVTSCSAFNSELANLVPNGGTINLNFQGSCFVLDNSTLQANTTLNGPSTGAVTLSSNNSGYLFTTASTLSINRVNFSNFTAPASNILNGTFNSTINLNHVAIHDTETVGGAVYVEGHLNVSNSRFYNLSSSGGSSALYFIGGATGVIASSSFTNNESTGTSYGAVGINGGTVTIKNSDFSHNSHLVSGAGGAVTSLSGSLTVQNSTFTSNTTQDDGGAISATLTDLTVENSSFVSNVSANTNGGAIYSEGSITVSGSTFFDNHSVNGIGGAISVPNNGSDIDNSTFVNNSAADGGAMFSEGGMVSNSTFWNNSVTTSGTTASVFLAGGSLFGSILANSNATPVIESSLTDAGANLFTDDSFVKTTTGDGASKKVSFASLKLKALALNKTSPSNSGKTKTVALGEGSSAIDFYSATSSGIAPTYNNASRLATRDQRGAPRPAGGKYDVGAYEVGTSAAVTHKTILFHGDSAKLTPHAKNQLRALAKSVQAQGVHSITLDGHTATLTKADPAGRKLRGKIAGARTRAVEKYLKKQFKKSGYSVTITRVIKGAADPVKSNRTEKGRKANRRVYITIK